MTDRHGRDAAGWVLSGAIPALAGRGVHVHLSADTIEQVRAAAGALFHKEAGLPVGTVAFVESGEALDVSAWDIRLIAEAIGVDPGSLIPSASDEAVGGR